MANISESIKDWMEQLKVKYDKAMLDYPNLALDVKKLRVEKGYTWRAVARDIAITYPDLHVDTIEVMGNISGNQMDGMHLCSSAREFLKEEIDEWN